MPFRLSLRSMPPVDQVSENSVRRIWIIREKYRTFICTASDFPKIWSIIPGSSFERSLGGGLSDDPFPEAEFSIPHRSSDSISRYGAFSKTWSGARWFRKTFRSPTAVSISLRQITSLTVTKDTHLCIEQHAFIHLGASLVTPCTI